MKMTRRRILGASLLAACTPGSWAADAFPGKPVKLVVPQTPGGASDAIARLVAQALSERWHQSVVVENKAGAGGNVGMEAVLAAPADGHTLLMSYVGTQAINGALYRKLNFDPGRDFVPTASLATGRFCSARSKLTRSLRSSKASRRSPLFTIAGSFSSAVSKVVKRS